MSVSRKERKARQAEKLRGRAERVEFALDLAEPHGLSRARLSEEAEVPESAIGGVCVWLRKHATEVGKTITVLRIGGEWIYGWAGSMAEHREEQLKRRKNESRTLAVTVETLTQSLVEQPKALDLRRQLLAAEHRLADVELQIEELTGQLRLIRSEAK